MKSSKSNDFLDLSIFSKDSTNPKRDLYRSYLSIVGLRDAVDDYLETGKGNIEKIYRGIRGCIGDVACIAELTEAKPFEFELKGFIVGDDASYDKCYDAGPLQSYYETANHYLDDFWDYKRDVPADYNNWKFTCTLYDKDGQKMGEDAFSLKYDKGECAVIFDKPSIDAYYIDPSIINEGPYIDGKTYSIYQDKDLKYLSFYVTIYDVKLLDVGDKHKFRACVYNHQYNLSDEALPWLFIDLKSFPEDPSQISTVIDIAFTDEIKGQKIVIHAKPFGNTPRKFTEKYLLVYLPDCFGIKTIIPIMYNNGDPIPKDYDESFLKHIKITGTTYDIKPKEKNLPWDFINSQKDYEKSINEGSLKNRYSSDAHKYDDYYNKYDKDAARVENGIFYGILRDPYHYNPDAEVEVKVKDSGSGYFIVAVDFIDGSESKGAEFYTTPFDTEILSYLDTKEINLFGTSELVKIDAIFAPESFEYSDYCVRDFTSLSELYTLPLAVIDTEEVENKSAKISMTYDQSSEVAELTDGELKIIYDTTYLVELVDYFPELESSKSGGKGPKQQQEDGQNEETPATKDDFNLKCLVVDKI